MGLNRFLEDFKGATIRGKLFKLFQLSKKPAKLYYSYLEKNGKYDFVDRSQGSEKLVYLMGGYQDYLWEDIIPRIEDNVPKNYDVCILSTGTDRKELRKVAEEHNWSYLCTRGGRIGPDQNILIREHPKAEYIFKLDEDILIGNNYFENLIEAHEAASRGAEYEVGYVAPVINLNVFSTGYFLDYLRIKEDFIDEFGDLKLGARSGKINNNPDAAIFIWEDTLPFEEKVEAFNKNSTIFEPIYGRFNIGAILFTREFWHDVGPFNASMDDALGRDENQFIRKSAEEGKVPIMATRALAGHFAFGGQKERVKNFWSKNLRELE